MQTEAKGSKADHFLDISEYVCPMTFVRTRLLLERMASGETAEIRLKGEEPLENVPDSVRELGHEVLGLVPEEDKSSGVWRLTVRKT